MRADLFAEGEHILHLAPDAVLYEEITYKHIFHVHKPVMPFGRYGTGETGGEGGLSPDYRREFGVLPSLVHLNGILQSYGCTNKRKTFGGGGYPGNNDYGYANNHVDGCWGCPKRLRLHDVST